MIIDEARVRQLVREGHTSALESLFPDETEVIQQHRGIATNESRGLQESFLKNIEGMMLDHQPDRGEVFREIERVCLEVHWKYAEMEDAIVNALRPHLSD